MLILAPFYLAFAVFCLAPLGARAQLSVEHVTGVVATDGDDYDRLGTSVDYDGATIIAGAPQDDTGAGVDVGSAYTFVRVAGAWVQQAKLEASDGAPDDRFGDSVAVEGALALVGVPLDDTADGADAGSVRVFEHSGTGWTETAVLTPSDAAAGDEFGGALALFGDVAVIGALWYDTPAAVDAGLAFVFRRTPTGWVEEDILAASDGGANHRFGSAVSIDGDRALVVRVKEVVASGELLS